MPDARVNRIEGIDRAHTLEVRHERAACRVRLMLHRPARPDRPTRRSPRPRRRGRADLRRSWPDRHQPRASRAPRSAGSLPGRRHPGGHQARPVGEVPPRCASDRRRTDCPTGQPLALGSVYDPTDAVGRLLFNVLAMVAEFASDQASRGRGHGGREGQGPTTRQAAQAQPETGSPPRVAGAQRRVQHPRGCAAVRSWPLHRVPSH